MTSKPTTHTDRPRPRRRVALVGADPRTRRALEACDWGRDAEVASCSTALAPDFQRQWKPEVVFIQTDSPEACDGSNPLTGRPALKVVLAANPTPELFDLALRIGAVDLVPLPADRARLQDCVDRVTARLARDHSRRRRLRLLRARCRALDAARGHAAQQVELLCGDLVGAYQELAAQMQRVARSGEYAAAVRHELDLEQLLRKTLEFMLEKVGPTNAAVFLPSNDREYALGGYVNYDRCGGTPELLLQHLADVVAPRLAERVGSLHITDNETLRQWIGKDSDYLADCHVLAVACRRRSEVMATLLLFRDASSPFDLAAADLLEAVAPLLGEHLDRVIRVHHRLAADAAPPSESGA